ncbi:PepSY domain-containing protein [Comamonas serinivorans]|nr:PepSY domain-containing protein [Comamonas serinivorans]
MKLPVAPLAPSTPVARTRAPLMHALLLALGLALAQPALASAAKQVAALQLAKLDLGQAIAAAQTQHGLTVIDVELEHERQQAVYEVQGVDAQGQVVELTLDAATGQALDRKADGAPSRKDRDRLAGVKIDIAEAVRVALKHQPGRAVEAQLDDHLGTISYHITVLDARNRDVKVRVSAVDGRILPAHPRAK